MKGEYIYTYNYCIPCFWQTFVHVSLNMMDKKHSLYVLFIFYDFYPISFSLLSRKCVEKLSIFLLSHGYSSINLAISRRDVFS